LLALLFLGLQPALPALLEPWLLIAPDGPGYTAAIHRMHEAHWATIQVFIYGASVLALIWRPRSPALAQFVLLSILIQAVGGLLVGDIDPAPFVALAIFAAAYPTPRDLLRFSGERPLSIPLFGLGLLFAALLAPDVWRSLRLQLAGLGGEHAAQHHWLLTAELELMIVAGGLLAAAQRPGWRALGMFVGLALIYLGLASISAPQFDGSWGALGGALATLGGAGFIGTMLREARKPVNAGARGWLIYTLVVLAAYLGVALVAMSAPGLAARSPAPAGTTVLAARDYQFDRIEIHVQAGQLVTLRLDNGDGALHQFDLDEFNIHAPMPARQSTTAQFTPTKPGTFMFYCALHVNPATKQGMAGRLVVAP
jgi:plastocyanin